MINLLSENHYHHHWQREITLFLIGMQHVTVRISKGFKCLFTYCFKSSFVLSQLLLTENAILCQKVDCKEKKTKKNLQSL